MNSISELKMKGYIPFINVYFLIKSLNKSSLMLLHSKLYTTGKNEIKQRYLNVSQSSIKYCTTTKNNMFSEKVSIAP